MAVDGREPAAALGRSASAFLVATACRLNMDSMAIFYALTVGILCGGMAGIISAQNLRSIRTAHLVGILGACVLAVVVNIGVLFGMAKLFQNAPFDARTAMQAAGNSFWLAPVFSFAFVAYTRRSSP